MKINLNPWKVNSIKCKCTDSFRRRKTTTRKKINEINDTFSKKKVLYGMKNARKKELPHKENENR